MGIAIKGASVVTVFSVSQSVPPCIFLVGYNSSLPLEWPDLIYTSSFNQQEIILIFL